MIYCQHCGAPNDDERVYCATCASPLRITAAPPARPHGAYAGFWLRFAALFIDSLIFSPLYVLVVLISLGAGSVARSRSEAFAAGLLFLVLVAGFIGSWLYFTLMESSSKQATLGKTLLGLSVTDLEGRRISFGRANARYFSKYFSSTLLCLGYFMAAFTERKQALHDIIASCLVLRR